MSDDPMSDDPMSGDPFLASLRAWAQDTPAVVALVLCGSSAALARRDRWSDHDFLVVDWKTSRRGDADPLQLALYRQAWAELTGVPVERVRAAFYYVRSGRLVEPDLPDRTALEQLLVLGDAGESG